MLPLALLLAHAALTWFLAGLIWVVQLVHYPLFPHVAADGFAAFERDHSRRITWIVAPTMLAELLTGLALLAVSPPGPARDLLVAGAALLAVVWVSTAVIQVPCHRRLASGFDVGVHRRLVVSNWIRTAAWSLRALLVSAALLQALA